MFDAIDAPKSRRFSLTAATSIAIHLGVGSALVIQAMWSIERLPVPDRNISVAALLPMGAPPPLPPAGRKTAKRETHKHIARDVQPTTHTKAPEAEESATIEDVSGGGDSGQVGGIRGGTGIQPGGTGTGRSIGIGLTADLVAPPPAPPKLVTPRVLRSLRISGDDRVLPPADVRAQVSRSEARQAVGIVQLCIDPRGKVERAFIRTTTGYPTYDRRLVSAVYRWRYRPYSVDGKAVPACTAVHFIYRVH